MANKGRHLCTQEEFLTRMVCEGHSMYGYFIKDRRGIFRSDAAQLHNIPEVVPNLPEWLVEHGHVAPESVGDWMAMFSSIERGTRQGSAVVALLSENGGFGKYFLRFNGIKDEEGNPYFAMISLEDITSVAQQARLRENDINALLQVAQKVFPELLTFNLTQGTYRLLQYDSTTTLSTPREGLIDDMIRVRLGGVVEEDRESFADLFSYENLRDTFIRQGKESAQLVYRRPGRDGKVYWFESTVMRQENSNSDDVLLVGMSRHVDAQKAEEARLREQLRQQAEEIRLTVSGTSRTICYYDVPTRTLTVPPEYAREFNMPEIIPDYPANIHMAAEEYYPEVPGILRGFIDAMIRGEPTGSCEVPFILPDRSTAWKFMEYAMVYDQEGKPLRAVIFLDDVTAQHLQAEEHRRLKESEHILQLIAQHSDRTVTYYDLTEKKVRFKDGEAVSEDRSRAAAFEAGFSLPENAEKLKRMFEDIRGGAKSGVEKMLFRNEKDERRWLDLKYSVLPDDEGKPATVLFSHKDITERYEHELAYLRQLQSVEKSKNHLGALEVDLETDLVESQGGRMLPPGVTAVGRALTDFGRQMVSMKLFEQDQPEGRKFFSSKYLLARYAEGTRKLTRVWQMRFQGDTTGWVRTEAQLMSDPYTGHIKAFFRLVDVTDEVETRMELQNRSERDGMTGLLNRVTAEAMVREKIKEKGRPGILVLLDLDDLKGINDTFGHKEGDRAINGIAETLKSHFRESDVLGRIGGDEFLVYLTGAAENADAIAVSLTSLLRKLAGIPIGAEDQRRIHCSIGCAVMTEALEPFETLFKQADTALYHVKRNGKNNFAFYTPKMDQEDYQFQAQKLFTLQSAKKFETAELQHLLSAIGAFYPLVMSMNLSTNDYYLMNEIADGVFSKVPTFGIMDNFVGMAAKMVHPSDVSAFMGRLSRKSLLEAYERGEPSARLHFRFRGLDGEYRWTEAAAIFYINEHGDVCDFTLIRWADERAKELEQLWMQKVLELAVISSFEYVCLINVDSGQYHLYGNEANTHAVSQWGSFDEVTREIRDNFIAPEEREAYYEAAKLSSVEAHMLAGNGTYSYHYTMPDGEREASFHWFEPTHTQLLMTVQRWR